MSILLADIDATCSSLGHHDGNKYYVEDDVIQSLKHLIWILRRDNQDTHEYRRYIGHKKVIQTDLLPMLTSYCDDPELSDVLLRLLVNLTNPTLLFFREDLPKDGAGRRTYLDLIEISHTYKEAFANSSSVWATLAAKLQKIMDIDVGVRMEEQSLVLERVLVLTRNVLQVPANPQHEKRVDNDVSIHDQVLWTLHESGMLDLVLYILSSEYENQFHLHALEITNLVFREQKVETLADASVSRSAAEKLADEQALVTARKVEKAKIRPPIARHSRFGGTYVYRNLKSISDRDLICHQPLDRVVQKDFNHDKPKKKANFRLAKDDDVYQRQSAFCIRLFLREFCIEILTSAFNNLVRQVRRVLERNHGMGSEGSGHDQSYLLWAIRFFLEFNRLNGFKLHLVTETLSTGSIHWICNQIQNDSEMIQQDKKKKIKWNRRLQLGIQAYREFLHSVQAMEAIEDEDTQALLAKLKNNMFYVVEYREIVLHLLLSYNENHYTRNYLRDLIDTVNVYLKMMEKFCQGSIVVQTKVKAKKKKKRVEKPKKMSKEEIEAKLANDWDERISASLSVVLTNDINIDEEDHPAPFDAASEKPIDEQRGDCMTRIHKLLRDEDFERAVLLMRAGRVCWPDSDCFGAQDIQPEDELLLMKEIYLTDIASGNKDDEDNGFWEELDNSSSNSEDDEEEEETTALKEVVMNFSDIEKRLLNPKVVRACTWCLQTWEKMNYREIKSAVTILHRIAVNLDVPAMLMQAQLFRVFQQVFAAPRDPRYEELRRLGQFVVRQFVKLAPDNPKIYAELLFFKSHRECVEMASGYSEAYEGGHGGKHKIWTEEQEEELRRLYMENQESPQTDQDVIDWILDNLIDKSRTRRGVIKKLKDLGLIFKAPTKKSNAAAANKNLFMREEDDKLRELYDEFRLEADCLRRIMTVFDKKRSKKAVVKRMVQLGLIADENEILPAKKPRNRREREREDSGSSSESSDDEAPRRLGIPRNFDLNRREIAKLRIELEESLKEAIEWIVESLNEAAEDFEEASSEIDDAIPIVPFAESQKSAVENAQFKKLLAALNFIEPEDRESYWKIPANMMPDELKERAQLLTGEDTGEEQNENEENKRNLSDDEEDDESLFTRLRKQHEALIYNEEDSAPAPKKVTKPKKTVEKKIIEKAPETPPEVNESSSSDDEDQQIVIKRKKKPQESQQDSDGLQINTQEIKQRLAELSDSSDDEITSAVHKKSKNLLDSSDDETSNLEESSITTKKSSKRDRSELDGASTPDENEMNASNNQLKRIRRIADSSDDE